MQKTGTLQHNWVKHVITPVEVLEGIDDQPIVVVDPDQQIIAEDHAVYGCDRCSVPLAGHFGSSCEPEDD